MDARAAPIVGINAHDAVDDGSAVLHDGKPHAVSFAFWGLLVVDPSAVVGDGQNALSPLGMEADSDSVGLAVLDGVLDCLLGNAVEVRASFDFETLTGLGAFEFALDLEK
jgi:hypothetical protein